MEEEIERISNTTYVEFYLNFLNKEKFPNRHLISQRFGQAFLNELYPELEDNELFYEESTDKAIGIIMARYVDFSLPFGAGRQYTKNNLFVEE